MVSWSVRVVRAGKELDLYDIMLERDDGCIGKGKALVAISKECDEHSMAV